MNAPGITPAFAAEPIPFKAEGPQPLLREIPPGKPYPVAALGPLAAAVAAVQDVTQAPVGIAAQSALSVASLAVQGFANVETLGGDVPCSLFCLTIAESGERKSSCDRLLMKGVRDHERAQADAFRAAFSDFEVAREIWQGKRKRLMTEAAAADKMKATAAEADLRALGPEPRAPLYPSLTAQEPTLEGLLKLYQIGRPALGLFSDEAGGFIGGHAMNSDNRLKTIAGLSQLWNGDTVNRIRSGDGASDYPGRRLAIHLMAQPIAARPLLADPQASGQGFLARFLITEPPSAIGTRLRRGHSAASEMAIAAFTARLGVILETPMPTRDSPQELAPARLPLAQGAKELLWRFYTTVETAQATGGKMEHVRAYGSKAAEQAARIAGVLTLWADLDAPELTPQAMGWGIDLAQFYLSEARRLAEAGLVSEETAKAERLRQWLSESWPHEDVTPSEILHRGPNPLRERKALSGPLSMLVKAGHLVQLPRGAEVRGKPRQEAYRIVRSGHAV
ncbi:MULTISPECIES: YfjI family protein [unclassified Haematobacter]|uniref:YfjI family protein n=1 Tax=unclassified Haematobacter TaxID=2640585 RepID=UPI0025BFE9D9|nr:MULTISPECIES: YfjI family protein [unclassified Haematobacter]